MKLVIIKELQRSLLCHCFIFIYITCLPELRLEITQSLYQSTTVYKIYFTNYSSHQFEVFHILCINSVYKIC